MRKLDQIDRYSVAVSSSQQSTLMLRQASSQIKNLPIHMTYSSSTPALQPWCRACVRACMQGVCLTPWVPVLNPYKCILKLSGNRSS